jgi:hypothetical protein
MIEQQTIAMVLNILLNDLQIGHLKQHDTLAIITRTVELFERYTSMSGVEKKQHTLTVLKLLAQDSAGFIGLDASACLSVFLREETINTIIDLSKHKYKINSKRKSLLSLKSCICK